jgi:phosphoribosylformimino-5-aminoimidazole carboxamide ribonucleotide (ProFAR) isomerase
MTNDFDELSLENKLSFIKETLNRPIRVCGMVKMKESQEEALWVGTKMVIFQIVESSQVDLNNDSQVKIMAASTHFNPVDLVCGIKDYK